MSDEDGVTSEETKKSVAETLDILRRRAGIMNREKSILMTNEDVRQRIDMIRRRAQTYGRGAT